MSEAGNVASRDGQLLPTQQANHFAVALNSSELLLAFGLSRLAMIPTAMGDTPEHSIEWVAALSISPVAARQLLNLLEANIADYEARFGQIPTDPHFKVTQSR